MYLWKSVLKLRHYHAKQIIGNLLILHKGEEQLFKTTQKIWRHAWPWQGDGMRWAFRSLPTHTIQGYYNTGDLIQGFYHVYHCFLPFTLNYHYIKLNYLGQRIKTLATISKCNWQVKKLKIKSRKLGVTAEENFIGGWQPRKSADFASQPKDGTIHQENGSLRHHWLAPLHYSDEITAHGRIICHSQGVLGKESHPLSALAWLIDKTCTLLLSFPELCSHFPDSCYILTTGCAIASHQG